MTPQIDTEQVDAHYLLREHNESLAITIKSSFYRLNLLLFPLPF